MLVYRPETRGRVSNGCNEAEAKNIQSVTWSHLSLTGTPPPLAQHLWWWSHWFSSLLCSTDMLRKSLASLKYSSAFRAHYFSMFFNKTICSHPKRLWCSQAPSPFFSTMIKLKISTPKILKYALACSNFLCSSTSWEPCTAVWLSLPCVHIVWSRASICFQDRNESTVKTMNWQHQYLLYAFTAGCTLYPHY